MKPIQIISTAFLSFMLLGTTTFASAQHDAQGEKRGEQGRPDEQHTQRGHGHQQEHAQQQQQEDRNKRQPHDQQQWEDRNKQQQHAQQQQWEDRNKRQSHGQHQQLQRTKQQRREQERDQHRVWQERRARRWESEHRTWQQRGGYHGYRIPDEHYRSHYGRNHSFRIYSVPFMYEGGNPRFQYGGYWFTPVDTYPEYWGAKWYQTDDVYVEYSNDGYYLYNRRYPRHPGIAISIAF